MDVWCTEFSTSFLGLLTSKKMITIILIKNDNILKLIIIIINFSQTFCHFVLSPHIFKSSTSATLTIVCWTSYETSQCRNFTQEFFCFSLFYSRNSNFLSPQFLNHPRCYPRHSQLHFHSQTI